MSDVRIGVIGTGFGARVVAPVFAATPGCDVVDVVSARDDAAVPRPCARPTSTSSRCTRRRSCTATHGAYALDAGHAVAVRQALRLERRGRGRDATWRGPPAHSTSCNLEFRYQPARQLRASSQLRRDRRRRARRGFAVQRGLARAAAQYGWLFDAERGGGWLGAWGSHFLDYVRWTFGEVVACGAELRTDSERPDADGVSMSAPPRTRSSRGSAPSAG